MIHIVRDKILESDCTIIGHQMNCFGETGTQLEREIKRKYPEAFEADETYQYKLEHKMGKFSYVLSKDRRKLIVNLYGQYSNNSATDPKALKDAIEMMLIFVDRLEMKGFKVKIGLPYFIGCGFESGKGDWAVIYNDIEALSRRYKRDIYLYK